jgi:hypothetical protein
MAVTNALAKSTGGTDHTIRNPVAFTFEAGNAMKHPEFLVQQ